MMCFELDAIVKKTKNEEEASSPKKNRTYGTHKDLGQCVKKKIHPR